MKNRRSFLKSATLLGAAGFAATSATHSIFAAPSAPAEKPSSTTNERDAWLGVMTRLSTPVLEKLAQRRLKLDMPVEAFKPAERAKCTHLEAWGRLLSGIAPWLAVENLSGAELKLQQKNVALVRECLDVATDKNSADFLNFNRGGQALVDSAFMAQGILRAPTVLWKTLEPRVQQQVIEALKSSRAIGTPHGNNWVMFAAMVEAALYTMGEKTIDERLEGCVREMLTYYKGDGVYGDGEFFHFDYYNSFVIHPMLVDVLAVLKQKDPSFEPVYAKVLKRAQRYASIQERLIAPDGTFPAVGRSITYRFGAFHSLAQIALMEKLEDSVKPAQVRSALTAVIQKMIAAPGTFDDKGWLQIGFYGHQPQLAEGYISTGSLYLCTVGLLPLGLPPANEFWSAPAMPWTACQIWAGQNLSADHAMSEK